MDTQMTGPKRIWKYSLSIVPGPRTIKMPKGARLLSVQAQHKVICFWALVDPMVPEEERTFQIFSTGDELVPGVEGVTRFIYLDTVLTMGGELVWHVFEQQAVK